MKFAILALVCFLIGSVMAYPNPSPDKPLSWTEDKSKNTDQQRWMLDGGYNKDQSGKDFHIQGQAPVWTSDNKRHEFDVAGHYGQHYGGPYGNSPPSYGAGGIYRFRF